MEHEENVNICLCKQISKDKMIEAIEAGATTVSMVKYKTGAGSGACHGRRCTPKIQKLLDDYQAESNSEVDA